MDSKVSNKFTDVLGNRLSSKLPSKLAERAERGPVVAVVRLQGVITSTSPAVSRPTISLQNVESALTRAFGHDRLSAVALAINSPGGSATQSALVADRIRELAAEKNVPVLAFCEDVAASGGYWLACAADEIYAHQTSMVGSVGVISASFGVNNLLERIGVERRVYTAGEQKLRLDPFRPEQEDDVRWLKGIQQDLHGQFADWVRERRGSAIADAGEQLFTGEVWTGQKAKELGLVDGLGNLRSVVKRKYPDAHVVPVEPKKQLLARLGVGGPGVGVGGSAAPALVQSVLDSVEHRVQWSRFGL